MTNRCEAELCPNWSGDGDVCPCAVFGLERPEHPVEVSEVTGWFTLPKWTRAHEVEQYGSLGYIRLWVTVCGRDYRREDHEYDDTPIAAPSDMQRCGRCVAAALRDGGE